MTAPRQVLPEQVYFITRRTTQRQYFLRPDTITNLVIEYCLAVAAARFNITLVAWVAMSNHYHAVIYDPEGLLPAFLEHFHRMTAKVLNLRWGRGENMWSSVSTSAIPLLTPADVLAKVVYILSNPAASHLVEGIAHWPGTSSLRFFDGRTRRIRRPDIYFDKQSEVMPKDIELSIGLPPWMATKMTFAQWSEQVRSEVQKKEERLMHERRADGRRVMGRKAVLAMQPTDSPGSSRPSFTRRPEVASRLKETRLALIEQLKEFRRAHREARTAHFVGRRDVLFPKGTYRMKVFAFGAFSPLPVSGTPPPDASAAYAAIRFAA